MVIFIERLGIYLLETYIDQCQLDVSCSLHIPTHAISLGSIIRNNESSYVVELNCQFYPLRISLWLCIRQLQNKPTPVKG